ncbi:MAG TPA: hypothetical protein VE262_16270 [Blastocatellia bacterium]|nr:hypothetical protein [Blastocatellia bacterium]
MDIDLDMNVLELDDYRQEQLNNTQVNMSCPNDHQVAVRLIRGAGSSSIYCPECSEMIEPRLPEQAGSRQQTAT